MMDFVGKTILGVGAALILGAGAATAATFVVNGSFEQGTGNGNFFGTPFSNLSSSAASWDIYTGTQVTGWTADTNGVEIQTDNTLPFIDAYDGENYVELDTRANSGITQDIALGIGRYILSFAYSPRVNLAPCTQPCVTTNGITYGLSDGSDDLFSQLADGPSSSVLHGVWTVFTQSFTISTAGTYTLFFDATGRANGYGGLLDGVAISAVPVPAGGLLLLGALGGLAALRRRKSI